jgi:hypothetical protein
MEVGGFRPGTGCRVWLRRPDGTRVTAGSFRYAYDGEGEAELSSAVKPDDATAIGLRVGSRTFVAPLPSRTSDPNATLNPQANKEEGI